MYVGGLFCVKTLSTFLLTTYNRSRTGPGRRGPISTRARRGRRGGPIRRTMGAMVGSSCRVIRSSSNLIEVGVGSGGVRRNSGSRVLGGSNGVFTRLSGMRDVRSPSVC